MMQKFGFLSFACLAFPLSMLLAGCSLATIDGSGLSDPETPTDVADADPKDADDPSGRTVSLQDTRRSADKTIDQKLDGACETEAIEVTPAVAEVHLVVDTSGSMNLRFDGTDLQSPIRIDVMREGIIEMVSGDQRGVNFGLSVFPGNRDSCSADDIEIDVAPNPNGAAEIISLVNSYEFLASGSTPSPQAMRRVRQYFAATPPAKGVTRYVVLATDGIPGCPTGAAEPSVHVAELVNEINLLRAAGIFTVVIGFDVSVLDIPEYLNLAAEAGGLPREGAQKFYPVSEPHELKQVFASTLGETRPDPCTFELAEAIDPQRDIFVLRNNSEIPEIDMANPTNGWKLLSVHQIQLVGTYCDPNNTDDTPRVYVDCVPELR